MTSKTFRHNCDVCEPECPNDAISMGPEISVIDEKWPPATDASPVAARSR
jgi:ferredoxin